MGSIRRSRSSDYLATEFKELCIGLSGTRKVEDSPLQLKLSDSIYDSSMSKPAMPKRDLKLLPNKPDFYASNYEVDRSLENTLDHSFDSAYSSTFESTFLSINLESSLETMEVKPVFANYFHNLSYSSDEGFEGSNSSGNTSPQHQNRQLMKWKVMQKWKSPIKIRTDPYFLDSSPLSLQKKKGRVKEEATVLVRPSRIDFVAEFDRRNLIHLIERVYSYCGNRELQKASEVCSLWRYYLSMEPFQTRRGNYREEKLGRIKNPNHNRHKVSPNWRTRKLRSASNHMNRNSNQISPLTKSRIQDELVPSERLQHLKIVKRNLRLGEEMIYCPTCNYPAKKNMENKGFCTMSRCLANFCCSCKLPWHEGQCDDLAIVRDHSSCSKTKIKKRLKKL